MLKGKVAVVTGGGRGIGAATVLKFAENGADVAIIYAGNAAAAEKTAEAAAKFGVKTGCYRCDVSSLEEVTATFKQIIADFGTVDILMNNAGVTADKLLMAMKEEDYDRVLNVNLKGAFNTIKQVYPVFLRKRSGKIINVSSISGLIGNPGQANYSASKAGLIGMTKSVARELASRNVCCNAIAPGFIETDMTENQRDNPLVKNIPFGRTGKPEDVANLALFLASPLSDYITGEVIRVDGGLAI